MDYEGRFLPLEDFLPEFAPARNVPVGPDRLRNLVVRVAPSRRCLQRIEAPEMNLSVAVVLEPDRRVMPGAFTELTDAIKGVMHR